MSKHRSHANEGSSHETKKKEDSNVWMITTFVLGVLLVVSIFTNGFALNNNIDTAIKQLNAINAKQSSPAVRDAITDAISSLNSAKSAIGSNTQGNADKGDDAGEKKILIEEFSDFQCPYCSRAYTTIKKIQNDYAGKVQLKYLHFPLVQIHPNAQKAAEAAECAKDQGKFWEMHDKMFENQQALSVDNLKAYAKDLGLDANKFNTCLDSGVKKAIVDKDQQDGVARGVSGTPTFFINGQKLVGAQPYESFKTIIDGILSGNAPAQPQQNTPPAQPTQPQSYQGTIDDDPIKGDKNAKVVIIEWSDFQCPYCKRFFTDTESQIMKEYVDTGKVRFVYRDYPLSFHQNAQVSAEASECADEQGKYWEFHDVLFTKGSGDGTGLDAASLKQYAADLKLDTSKFNTCLDSKKFASEVQKDMSEGSTAGITGTPGFVVGIIQSDGKTVVGEKVSGAQPFANFKAVIDAQLAKA